MVLKLLEYLLGIVIFSIIGFVFFMAFYGGTKEFIEYRKNRKRIRFERYNAYLEEQEIKAKRKAEKEAKKKAEMKRKKIEEETPWLEYRR